MPIPDDLNPFNVFVTTFKETFSDEMGKRSLRKTEGPAEGGFGHEVVEAEPIQSRALAENFSGRSTYSTTCSSDR